jgi:Rha family phage regulatory protein
MSDAAQSIENLHLRADGLVPVVNSRDVAEVFGKRHFHVLRDIEALKLTPDLDAAWFRPTGYVDDAGRTLPAYDMTRDGFTLLVMGWTGPRAMKFKVAYIQAFNAMEARLRATGDDATDKLVAGLNKIADRICVRADGHDLAIDRVETRVGGLEVKVDVLVSTVAKLKKPRPINSETKRECVRVAAAHGNLCPCCLDAKVVDDGVRSPFAEFDHFYGNVYPSPDSVWLVCKPCHGRLTNGTIPHDVAAVHFHSYQARRRALPSSQSLLTLF